VDLGISEPLVICFEDLKKDTFWTFGKAEKISTSDHQKLLLVVLVNHSIDLPTERYKLLPRSGS